MLHLICSRPNSMMEIIEVLDQTQFNMYKQFTSRPQGRGMIAFIASNNITFYDLYCSTCRICISFQVVKRVGLHNFRPLVVMSCHIMSFDYIAVTCVAVLVLRFYLYILLEGQERNCISVLLPLSTTDHSVWQ